MNTPRYKIIRWKHGWSLEGSDRHGMPMDGLGEALKIIGERDNVIDPGLEHHLRVSGFPNTVCVIGKTGELQEWRGEVEAELESSEGDAEARWLRGTDVGLSSLAIFCALAENPRLRGKAYWLTKGETPVDEEDLGRCRRLLEKFPDWEKRLDEVVRMWPHGPWEILAGRWEELKTTDKEGRRKILDAARGAR